MTDPSEIHAGARGVAPAFQIDGTPVWPDANRIGNIHVEPRCMDAFMLLVASAPGVVPLEQLLVRVWHNAVVGDGVVHQAISHLRRALHDDRKNPRYIETIPRRGYRLVARVVPDPAVQQVANAVFDGTAPAPRKEQAPAPMAAGPADSAGTAPLLAVLPFDNLSNDPGWEFFCDGVCDEILQTVGRTTGIRVIGRSSSFQFRGADKAANRVAGELGCSHVLDGSVRHHGERVRVSAQLVECESQELLWNDRFDYELADFFLLQDLAAAEIARALRSRFGPYLERGPADPPAGESCLQVKAPAS